MKMLVDMIKRLLVIFALVVLFAPINASAPGGSGQSQPELRVTIHEVCKASYSFEEKDVSNHDNLSATFDEVNVYRIMRYDGGEGLADLQLVSHQANISLEGGGTLKIPPPGQSESWTYQVDQDALRDLQSRATTGVNVSFTGGSVEVGVANNPCSSAKASSPLGGLGGFSHSMTGYTSFGDSPFERELRSRFKRNSQSIAVHGHASFTDTELGFVISREVDYSVTGADYELPEAEIIPPDSYNTWVPEAGEDESTPGNVIVATVKLHKRGDPKKSAGKKAKFRFALSDVSHELGVCLNWPPKWSTKGSPDLKIDPNANSTLKVAGDGQSATTRNSGESATVRITSYDWGAYGHLTATAILDGDGEVTAYVLGDQSKPALAIPKDDNGNHIADFWEKRYLGGSSEANADDDLVPLGNNDQGDGLSLYEEYRGFRVQGKHIRTSPIEKDLFVCDLDHLTLGYFAQSGLTVHLIKVEEAGYEVTPGSANDFVINANRGFATRGPQHILSLIQQKLDGDYGYTPGTGPGVPKTAEHVLIDRTTCLRRSFQELQCTIAHELAHGCNAWHHGSGNYRISRWRELQPNGAWSRWWFDTLGVAAQGGQESGVEECIMRYDGTNLYETATGPLQWEKPDGSLQRGAEYPPVELPGTIFCNDKKGTGVNDPDRPQSLGGPKAGNASKGKCRTQFCVNDSKPCKAAE
jgi:hypothetical protein